MKFKLTTLIKSILFGLALGSSIFPRPLDFTFLKWAIIVFTTYFLLRLPKLIHDNLRVKLFFGVFISLLIFFALSHGYYNTVNSFYEDGLLAFVPAFLFYTLFFGTTDEHDQKSFLVIFYLFVSGVSSISILQFFGVLINTKNSIAETFLYAPIYRSTAFFPHSTANTLWLMSASLVLLFVPILNFRHLVFHSIVSLLSMLALSATQGRAGFLIFLTATIFKLILELSASKTKKIELIYFLKPILIFTSIFIFILAILFIAPSGPGNRFSDFFNTKAKHSQRLQENYLGKEILLKYPLGAGPDKISEVANKIRNEDPYFKKGIWIFKEWHGIHNGFLHYASIWGWPGLLFVIACLFIPVFLKTSPKSIYIISVCFSAYLFTDNIFYREISSIFAFTFLASIYFKSPKLVPASNRFQSKKYRILKLSLTIGFALVSTLMVPLRTYQIEKSKVVSLAIDNPSSSHFLVFIDKVHVRTIQPNSYLSLFFNPDKTRELILQSPGASYQIGLNFKNVEKNHSGFWLTTVAENNYSFLYFKKDIKSDPTEVSTKAFTIYPIDQYALDIENFILDEKGNRLKHSENPIFTAKPIQDEFMRDSKFRCFEPSQYNPDIGIYNDACLVPTGINYSTSAINQVLRR